MTTLFIHTSKKLSKREKKRLRIIDSAFGLQKIQLKDKEGIWSSVLSSGECKGDTSQIKLDDSFIEANLDGSTGHVIALFISEKRPNAKELENLATTKVWWFCDGDPRRVPFEFTNQSSNFNDKSRVAITLREMGTTPQEDLILAFSDPLRNPWENSSDLQYKVDLFIPQLVEIAIDSRSKKKKTNSAHYYAGIMSDDHTRINTKLPDVLCRILDGRFYLNKIYNIQYFNKKLDKLNVIALHNPAPDICDSLLSILGKKNRFIPYPEVVNNLLNGKQCNPGISVTFDDGYKENMLLLDILEKHHCSAMFFLNSCTIDNYKPAWFMNEDKNYMKYKPGLRNLGFESFLSEIEKLKLTEPCCLRKRFGLTSRDIKTIVARGHSIGVHTHNHPFLHNLTETEIQDEIIRCQNSLRKILQDEIFLMDLAYPNGDFNDRVIKAVKKVNIRSAVTTVAGPVENTADLFKINRTMLSDNDYPGVALMKLSPLYRTLIPWIIKLRSEIYRS